MPTYSDEPTLIDQLDREPYIRALSKVALTCETPLVIGIHGGWGSGKSSLMLQIKKYLEEPDINTKLGISTELPTIKTVWYNPWLYQFEEAPIIPLFNELYKNASGLSKAKIQSLKFINVAGNSALQLGLRVGTAGGLDAKTIHEFGEKYEKEVLKYKTNMENIREQFKKAVITLVGQNGRLFFFIDDLDRCLPEVALRTLEAIKLFLNVEGCVFFLAIDKTIIDKAIHEHYKVLDTGSFSYLDKIIQLPFEIPAIADDSVEKYIKRFINDSRLSSLLNIFVWGAERNPRTAKRYMNAVFLLDSIAQENLNRNYQPALLFKLLSIQLKFGNLYNHLLINVETIVALEKYFSNTLSSPKITSYKKNNKIFLEYMNNIELGSLLLLNPDNIMRKANLELIKRHLFLTHITDIDSNVKPNSAFMKPMKPSPQLAAIVGSKSQPRTVVTKKLWEYIKKHNLQDNRQKTMIHADDKLKPIFEGKNIVSMFEMTKYLVKHLS